MHKVKKTLNLPTMCDDEYDGLNPTHRHTNTFYGSTIQICWTRTICTVPTM